MKTYFYNKDQSFVTSEDGAISVKSRKFPHILKQVENGEAEILDYVEPDITLDQVRAKRNSLLEESDKYFLYSSAAPLPAGVVKDDIKTYRQSLRDLTEELDVTGIKSLEDLEWPSNPLETV